MVLVGSVVVGVRCENFCMIVVLENFVFGFDGVVVFMIEIVELDKDGGVLCYCGVDIEDLVS